jgi:hypothetical protein
MPTIEIAAAGDVWGGSVAIGVGSATCATVGGEVGQIMPPNGTAI